MKASPMLTFDLALFREDGRGTKAWRGGRMTADACLKGLRHSGQGRRPALHRALRNQRRLERPSLRRAGRLLAFIAIRSHLLTAATGPWLVHFDASWKINAISSSPSSLH